MRQSRFLHSLAAGLTFLLTTSAGNLAAVAGSTPLNVVVSILPQAFFVERIGGSQVKVEVLVGPGKSHHTYEPTPQQMVLISKSDICFLIGVPFEKGLATRLAFTLPNLTLIQTQKGVPLKWIPESGGQGEADPHIWLDPHLVQIQAENIYAGLVQKDPEHRDYFETNLKSFKADLEQVDSEIKKLLAPFSGSEIYVFHPAFGYFLERYGLKQCSIEVEGKEPGPRHLAEIISRMKEHQVKVLFVQPQFSSKTAESIAAAVGAQVITIDPLAPDYLANLREMTHQIAEALSLRDPD